MADILISLGEGPLFVLTLFFEGDEHMAYPHKRATSPEPKIGDRMPDDAPRVSHRAAHRRVMQGEECDARKPSSIACEPCIPKGDRAADAIGSIMPDGSVFAGISPDTNKPMYATPTDAPLTMTFNEAKDYAATLVTHGHQDWRVPTRKELNVLFNNRAAIGGFNPGPYWSASRRDAWSAWDQRFSDGQQNHYDKVGHSSVRCVR
jgi:Protein of unknown function (DUF1566)